MYLSYCSKLTHNADNIIFHNVEQFGSCTSIVTRVREVETGDVSNG